MAGGNFFGRVINYVVNEIVVEGLANRKKDDSFAASDRAINVANATAEKVKWQTNKLVEFPAFQRFAVRTSKRIEDISDIAAKKRREIAEQVKDLSKNFEQPKGQ